MPILSNSMVTRPLTQQELDAMQLPHDAGAHRHAHAALLLSLAAGQPRADRQPQRDHRRRRARSAPLRCCWSNGLHRKFPALRGIDDRLFMVGLGGRQPRHDAARVSARSDADACTTRSATAATACRILSRPGGGSPNASPAKGAKQTLPIFTSPLAGPPVCAVPANRPADAVSALFPPRRKALMPRAEIRPCACGAELATCCARCANGTLRHARDCAVLDKKSYGETHGRPRLIRLTTSGLGDCAGRPARSAIG